MLSGPIHIAPRDGRISSKLHVFGDQFFHLEMVFLSRLSATLTLPDFGRVALNMSVTVSISAVDLALLSPDGGIRWNIKMSVA